MLIIQRRDPEKSMDRFYALDVHPDLISGWTLLREWGRIGSPGRVVIEPFAGEQEAAKAGAEIEAAKRRRGYRDQVNRLIGGHR
jgi:predicted DNA-binding WGR domain protein